MNQNFTLEELTHFTVNEDEYLAKAGLRKEESSLVSPSQDLITSLLNYSKSLSIRKTDLLGDVEIVLN